MRPLFYVVLGTVVTISFAYAAVAHFRKGEVLLGICFCVSGTFYAVRSAWLYRTARQKAVLTADKPEAPAA